MQHKFHIRKNDTVTVLAGDSKGQQGKVLSVDVKNSRALVEGVNLVSKHTKPNAATPNGGIVKKEASIHISNLMLLDGGKPTKVGRKLEGDKLVRYAKKSGTVLK